MNTILFDIDLENCLINTKYCSSCQNFHHISFAMDHKTKLKHFYSDAHLKAYVQYSSESVFELRLLKHLVSDILFQKSTFRNFTASFKRAQIFESKNYGKLKF